MINFDRVSGQPSNPDPQTEYPGTDLAYAIAVNSYDAIIKRLDFVDGRIQTLMAFAITTTAIVPSVANARGVPFRSIWFVAAMATVGTILIAGSYARHVGRIEVINPAILYKKWLGYSEWEFKKNLIYWAGEDYATNTRLLEKKWRLSVAITFLFFLEVVFLVAWVAAAIL